MPEIWITPQFVNQPKQAGGKFGSVKCNELGYLSVPVEALHNFAPRKRIFIEYTMKGEYKNFVKFPNPQPHQAAPAPRPTQNFDGRGQDVRQPPRQQPAVQVRSGMRPVEPTDPTAMNIFVTGIVGRALGSGHFQATDISELTREAKTAFLLHLNGPPSIGMRQTSAPEPEFNDPLPDPNSYGAQPEEEDGIPF